MKKRNLWRLLALLTLAVLALLVPAQCERRADAPELPVCFYASQRATLTRT
ncbi:MAG: hypothetical protein KGZ57_02115 [Dethiobacter sp.]|nr:hypothetical protein [Dethiobacter sp.]